MNWLSAWYGAAARARRDWYERHPERQRRLHRPVFSIGNLSVGGSGKTPAVAHIARLLIEDGEQPAILSRGYGREQRTDGPLVVSDGKRILADLRRAGDEPLMLARAVRGAAVVVGADRYGSGLVAEQRINCTVHLLDDGFQHVQLARDVDIVLVDRDDLRDRVLPAGRLREETSTLERAHALVLAGDRTTADGIVTDGWSGSVFRAARVLQDRHIPREPILAVAGIARPSRFFDQLTAAGARVAATLSFADHQRFTRSHIERISRAALACGAARVVTTDKDFVRLLPLRPFPLPIQPIPLEFAIEPAAAFREWLRGCLAAIRRGQGPRRGIGVRSPGAVQEMRA